ncbi:MAG: BrnT family toxin [Propionibacteriaceae bacterium]|nr:BrnT family toxin [Propionibacteriaceae bacterium]
MSGRGGGGEVGPAGASPQRFEWDPAKSASNKLKHGVDFDEATAMWRDSPRLEIDMDHPVEPGLLVIGPLNGRIWTAVTTMRGDAINQWPGFREGEKPAPISVWAISGDPASRWVLSARSASVVMGGTFRVPSPLWR